MSGEKTEQPTAQKLRKARRDGQATSRTPELGAWTMVLATSVLLPPLVERGAERMSALTVSVAAFVSAPDIAIAPAILREGALAGASTVLPFGACLFVVGLLGNAAQGGVHVATKQFQPQFKRLNPFTGLKRMFGPQGLWELAKTILKTAILGVVVWYALRSVVPVLAASGTLPLSTVLATVWDATISMLRLAGVAGIVMAAADYAVVRRRTNKGLRMSKQDVKDEHKRSEGDPMLKGAIRSKQMSMSRNRMMSEVKDADVIVVNPTHIAVALRYDPSKGAPRVVAKGAGAIAAKIRAEAQEHRVPVVQDVPLARTLHKACELNQEIPADLYAAVARVLAFVMSLKSRGSAAGTHKLPVLPGARA